MTPPPLPAQTLSYASTDLEPTDQIVPILAWVAIAYGSVKFLSAAFKTLSEINRSFGVERSIETAWTFLGLATNAVIVVGGVFLLRRSRRAATLLLPAAIMLIVIEALRLLWQLMDYYAGGSHFAWFQPSEIVSGLQTFIVPAMLIALLRKPVVRRIFFR
jgi:hypothetical protein